MLRAFICLLVVGALLHISENISKRRLMNAENQRKLVHITTTIFIASWPWILSWGQIKVLAVLMLIGVLLNRSIAFFSFNHKYRQENYGDIFLAVAVFVTAFITDDKVFFAIAMLSVALADGLAAVAGANWGKKWQYKIFGQTKTVIGSMTFWLAAVCVIGIGTLFAEPLVSFGAYLWLIIALPPFLLLLENASIYGSDNLIIPIVVVVALSAAQSAV